MIRNVIRWKLRARHVLAIGALAVIVLLPACALLNQRPDAAFTYTPAAGAAPLDVVFDASSSQDVDGVVVDYAWEFGDGETGTGVGPTHRYDEPGEYVAQLTVTDNAGRTQSFERTIVVNAPARHAIIIGLAAYYYAPCLYYVDDDVLAIRQTLLDSPGWDSENIAFLLNADATSWNVAAAFDDLDAADENDLLFVYFSGHGGRIPDDDPGEEADGFDEALFLYDSAYISDDALEQYLARVPMRRIVVMVDSCFSGGLLGGGTAASAAGWADDWMSELRHLDDVGAQDLDELSKRIVAITASHETEYSWEIGTLEHGVFSYAILEALSGLGDAWGDGDGYVSAEECFTVASQRVPELMAPVGEDQRPQILDAHPGELEFYPLP